MGAVTTRGSLGSPVDQARNLVGDVVVAADAVAGICARALLGSHVARRGLAPAVWLSPAAGHDPGVRRRAAGRASVYSLRQPALLGLLAAAEAVLEATGSAVALCPDYGQAW